jgi:hypothetical protein
VSPGSSVVYGPFHTVSSTVTSVSFRMMCLHAFPMQLSGIFWIGMDFVVALALMTIGDSTGSLPGLVLITGGFLKMPSADPHP